MKARPQRVAQYHEGPNAALRFEQSLGRILAVTKGELIKREETYQKSREHKDRPGPKRRK